MSPSALLLAVSLAGGAPLVDTLPWDGVTVRTVVDEVSGVRLPVPLTSALLTSRHFPSARPGVQARHVFTLSGPDGEAVEVAVFENPKALTPTEFVDSALSFLRLAEHAELPWTATPAKVSALLFEHPRTGQQYASRAAVFPVNGVMVAVACRNIEDRFAAGAFAAVLEQLEVRR